MRRKGRDSSGKSSDSPRKSSRFTRTSTASNKKEDSVENVQEAQEENNSVSDVSLNTQHDEHEKEYHTGIAENSTEESNRQVEGEEESEKGKSNDIVKTNVEQSRDIIEPESENENVQGTAQSPSKDKDENIQNVNDLQTNLEETEENQQTTHPNVDKTNQECEGTHFESEYLQETETNNENSASNRDDCVQELQNSAKKSATPEPADHKLNRSLSNDSYKSKPKEVTERKKITLRRSPPVKERRSSVQETGDIKNKERRSSVQEISDKDIKTKKITLKRPTTEEKNSQNDTETAKEVKRRFSTSEDEHDKKRRMSTSAEERAQESTNEETVHKPTTKVKLIRSISLANDVNKNDESNDQIVQKPHRKPVWGKSSSWLSNLTATMYKIDMESIKIVCPTVQFLKENELKLESVPRERKKSESELHIKRKVSLENTNNKSEAEEEYSKDTSEEESEPEAPKENIIAFNRKISIVDDTASKLKPPPSPAKNPVSDVLFITNLVRPFTVKQLKELLERTGKIKEDGFWTDRIKSKCYVQYYTTDEAETTRNALHGVFWPIGNGKQLIIDYATEEDLRSAQKPPPPIQHIQEKKIPEKEIWEPSPVTENRFKEKERFEDSERRRRSSERESHRGKQAERRRSGSRSKDRTKPGKYSHRSYTPEGRSNVKRQKKEEPAPQKLMDDLFLKTKATPSIYWQPLSPEEIATKQKQRLVRMEELKRRIEQTRDRRVRDSRRPPYRRR